MGWKSAKHQCSDELHVAWLVGAQVHLRTHMFEALLKNCVTCLWLPHLKSLLLLLIEGRWHALQFAELACRSSSYMMYK